MSSTSEHVDRPSLRGNGGLDGGAELRQTVHDFKNLLTLITGHSELLLKRLAEGDPLRGSVEAIRMAAESGAELTRELLAAAPRGAPTTVLDVNEMVGGIVKMLGGTPGDDVEIVTKLDPALGRVRGNRTHLEQAIVNLALNAQDAMPHGGRLTFETGNIAVVPALARRSRDPAPGPHVAISVSDTGSGMDGVVQARVFQRHFTTKGPHGGSGLGLSVVEEIVREHGGHVSVSSALGHGSTFTVYLPRVADEIPAHTGALSRAGETVMVVEDEPDLLELMREILELHGYTVLKARDGAEALEVSRAHRGPLHLVLTDVALPKLGVRALLRELLHERPGIRALYVSGHAEDHIARTLGPLHETDLLRKPFAVGVLADKVREILDRV